MKYSEKYPSARVSEEPEDKLFLSGADSPCCMCGNKTAWVDMNLKGFVCSEECSKNLKETLPKQYSK